uniref:histone acetyltransferase n=2 Tax=Polytomella parva TaxID=51329 RepID=A0A7S0VK33_9CHLO|mmetsp:Transcript_5884/g.11267  ORF Transcript_5884/g.11267 Transcript_5884/m.11267 type:complete len:225 (+) Transcript_5884:354-1028(+)
MVCPAITAAATVGYWCHPCYQEIKTDRITLTDGSQIRKTDLIKRKNDDVVEEGWVQCDACNAWVHMICGLFNKGRNARGVAYLCPECLLEGMKKGVRRKIETRPQAMLEAKDLAGSRLSEYISARVAKELNRELAARRAAAASKARQQVLQQHECAGDGLGRSSCGGGGDGKGGGGGDGRGCSLSESSGGGGNSSTDSTSSTTTTTTLIPTLTTSSTTTTTTTI